MGLPPEAATPPSTSLVARLFNIFAAPGDVFDEIRPKPVSTANWVAPAVILVAVSWLAMWVVFSQEPVRHQFNEMIEQSAQKQAEKMHLSEQQAEQQRQMAVKAGFVWAIGATAVGAVASAFFTPFIWGAFLWLVGGKVMRGGFTYMKAVEAVGLCNMIEVLDGILKALLIVVLGNLYASASLALLIKNFDPQNTLHGLAAYVNLMTFWLLAVRAIALARLAQTSFAKAAAWVFGIWFAYSAFFMGLALGVKALVKHAAH